MLDLADFARARRHMVETQLERRGVRDPAVLEAMREVPREAFVEQGFEEFAYEDSALPIAEAQTISQPYIVALMIEAAAVKPGDRVLEVGAGSGYAAAVLSRIARRVHAIERHPALVAAARGRLAGLGYDNVVLRAGDGTMGWPEAAPFDAIIVSAGGPAVPPPLKAQLRPGGRLVIPVGGTARSQVLTRLTRDAAGNFAAEELIEVRFVPLIGEPDGQDAEGQRANEQEANEQEDDDKVLPRIIARAAEPLPDLDDPAFGRLFDRFADRRVVLLGEATHGTSEFYRARAAITRRLIETHGFTAVAVEADWPDAAAVDRHVRHRPPRAGEPPFRRFPSWMWRNAEVEGFVEWLRQRNGQVAAPRRAGFFGLDLYNLGGSIAAVLDYLDRVDPGAARIARERYGCLTPWQREPAVYGRAVLTDGYRSCEEAVVAQCRDLLARRLDHAAREDEEGFFDAAQNARLIAAGERYYRAMYRGGAESWNLRDQAMFDALEHLLEARGPQAKVVVWAHNSHVGDARFTEMGTLREELTIGQLCRERFGAAAALIGLGTHGGTVAAASDWGGEMEVMTIRPPVEGSYEDLCHRTRQRRFLLDLGRDGNLRHRLLRPRLERLIGVIYRPQSERLSHYIEASLPQQFDAFVWFDTTSAVAPLGPRRPRAGAAETYPFGL